MSLMSARVSTNNDAGHIFVFRLNKQLISQAICAANCRPKIRMKMPFLVLIFLAKAHCHDTRDHIPKFFVKLCGWTEIASIDGHFTVNIQFCNARLRRDGHQHIFSHYLFLFITTSIVSMPIHETQWNSKQLYLNIFYTAMMQDVL